jgi:hypothetical protein
MVFEDLQEPGAWRVEWFDSNGAAYITMFAGRSAEERARDYHDAIAQGRLGTRTTDTQQEAEVLKELLINLRIMAHCAFDSRATVWTGS